MKQTILGSLTVAGVLLAILVIAGSCSKTEPPTTYQISCACPQGLPSYSGETIDPTFNGGLWHIPFKTGDGVSPPVITQCICNAIPKVLVAAPFAVPIAEPTVATTAQPSPEPPASKVKR